MVLYVSLCNIRLPFFNSHNFCTNFVLVILGILDPSSLFLAVFTNDWIRKSATKEGTWHLGETLRNSLNRTQMEYPVFFWKFALLLDLCYATIKMHLYNSYAHAHHVHLSKARKRLHEMYLSFSFLLRIRKKKRNLCPATFLCSAIIQIHSESYRVMIQSHTRAEKSAEAFWEQKFVFFLFLSFFMQTVYIPPIVG